MNFKGQLFSPDLIVALGVFIFALVVFFGASNSIFYQSSLFDSRKSLDETSHMVMNSLILSCGSPSNWENSPLSDVNSIGLASANNVIAAGKAVSFVGELGNAESYAKLKTKLGLGPYDFYFRLLDSSGNALNYNGVSLEGGKVASDPKVRNSITRSVLFNGAPAEVEGVFSLEK